MREASTIALKTFRGEVRSWIKGHDSPVSDADIAVDNFLREKLSRPGIGWLSEESADDLTRLDGERIFIVDPIDGTRSYLAGREDWSICRGVDRTRAAGRRRRLRAGVRRDVCCLGRRRAPPATARGSRRQTAQPSMAPASPVRNIIWNGSRQWRPGSFSIPKIHSLALRLARVAGGQIDAAFASVNARDWDLAAADLLVHEAGGAMTGVSGEPLVYNLHNPVHGALIAAGRARHATLIGLVRERWKNFS